MDNDRENHLLRQLKCMWMFSRERSGLSEGWKLIAHADFLPSYKHGHIYCTARLQKFIMQLVSAFTGPFIQISPQW